MSAKFLNNQNETNWQHYSKQRKLCTKTNWREKHVNEKNSLEQLMTWNKNGFFKFVEKITSSGTNHTNTMIDADSLNDYFANIGKSLASG